MPEPAIEAAFYAQDGDVQIIAAGVPGTRVEQVRNCYLLCGLRNLFQRGEARFTDDEAREVCREMGCYDRKSHSRDIGTIGNLIVGPLAARELTVPGLRAAAEFILAISPGAAAA